MAKKKASASESGASNEDAPVDFESSLAEVEQIVARLESGELGLSDSLQQYENGIKQLKQCHKLLDAAEQRVTLLSGFDSDGNPVTEPLEDSPKGENRPKRSRKRAARQPGGGEDSVDGTGELF